MKSKSFRQFLTYGLLLEIIFCLFLFIKPIKEIFGDFALVLKINTIFLIVIILLLLATFIDSRIISQVELEKIKFKYLFLLILVLNLTLLFVQPIGSDDIHTYIFRSRLFSKYQVSPYFVTYNRFPNDHFFSIIRNWGADYYSPYGPLITLVGAGLTFLGNDNLWLNIFLFKLTAICSHLVSTILARKITGNNMAPVIYGLNPMLLFAFAIDGHNDVLMIFFLFLAILFLAKKINFKNHLLSGLFFLLSVLTKYLTLWLLPFFYWYLFSRIPSVRAKIKLAASGLISGLPIVVLCYFPFLLDKGLNLGIFKGLVVQNLLKKSFSSSFLIITVTSFLQNFSVVNAYSLAIALSRVFFFLTYLILTFKFLRLKQVLDLQTLIKYSCLGVGIFLLTYPTWMFPWYFSTLLALLALYFGLTKNRSSLRLILGTTYINILMSNYIH